MIQLGDTVRVLFVGDKEAVDGILIEFDKKCSTSYGTIEQGTSVFGGYIKNIKLLRRKKHEQAT